MSKDLSVSCVEGPATAANPLSSFTRQKSALKKAPGVARSDFCRESRLKIGDGARGLRSGTDWEIENAMSNGRQNFFIVNSIN